MIEIVTRAEEEQLLGRPVETLLAAEDRAWLEGQRCLVTGAGGTVGGELARHVAACGPAELTLLDHGEHGLFTIERDVRERCPDVPLGVALVDVTRAASVQAAVQRARPTIVFHAAAYKHVTMAERAVVAATRVNVLGTMTVLAALEGSGARFVLISSDKAVAPRSVMGATKRLAELLTVAHAGRGIDPLVVRFGNVLASSGSVVELMLDCMRQGKPLPLTSADATRYFMARTEAASLVMKAATIGRPGETLWLDMGDQVRMGELVERVQAVGTGRGWPRVAVETIGLRPGEKPTEQLTAGGVSAVTSHPRIRSMRDAGPPAWRWELTLRTLARRVEEEDAVGVLSLLNTAVVDFEPSAAAWEHAGASPSVPKARTA